MFDIQDDFSGISEVPYQSMKTITRGNPADDAAVLGQGRDRVPLDEEMAVLRRAPIFS